MTTGKITILDNNGAILATVEWDYDGYPEGMLSWFQDEVAHSKCTTAHEIADVVNKSKSDHEYVVTERNGRLYVQKVDSVIGVTLEGYVDEIDFSEKSMKIYYKKADQKYRRYLRKQLKLGNAEMVTQNVTRGRMNKNGELVYRTYQEKVIRMKRKTQE